jgi:hypothetical protein
MSDAPPPLGDVVGLEAGVNVKMLRSGLEFKPGKPRWQNQTLTHYRGLEDQKATRTWEL